MITPPSSPGIDSHQPHVTVPHQAMIPPSPVPSLPPSHQTDKFDPTSLSDKALLVEDYSSVPPPPECASMADAGVVPHENAAVHDDITLFPPLCSPNDFFKLHPL
uniref:Uncharacterized protein n=1 Tax=Pseudictyota dubia TaxID=2749911 RepID=A0A7R9W9G7_9STRA|mmetsp:Transcript_40215/g.74382  ORF Transcript_40215/g.74382 Transcript_40215/m.74382 type:complete len:105 (+) Transcript_40215:2-316(+)